ncbi:MAG: electron transport complex subunit E [Oscillospiraceae bacterium]|nr:electron transport complex subunit E [Oscillospiraceae bacterium]
MTRLKKTPKLGILTNGLVKENPVLVSLLGICPALAVSTQSSNALGMGIAATFVLICSNIAISSARGIIPKRVRIPCYIVLIAGFVSFVQMFVEAFAYPLYQALGIFLPLIVVNCIVFSRAEVFARKNSVINSAVDALGMGAGFTLALTAMASIREILGSGTWFGISIPLLSTYNIPIFTMAPGGFVVFAILIAIVNKVSRGKALRRTEFGCAGCPSEHNCGKGGQ